MVFQQYSLFPWKTVRDNVAFGPYATGAGRAKSRAIADELLDMVGLARFAGRYPAELSGGMQQRVGIARALANKPTVLLMDEPFGALDAQTRHVMQENLLRVWAEFKITVLFVTHDVDEAIFLADRVLVMSAAPGRIIEDVTIPLSRPRDPDMTTTDRIHRAQAAFPAGDPQAESLKAFEDQDQVMPGGGAFSSPRSSCAALCVGGGGGARQWRRPRPSVAAPGVRARRP